MVGPIAEKYRCATGKVHKFIAEYDAGRPALDLGVTAVIPVLHVPIADPVAEVVFVRRLVSAEPEQRWVKDEAPRRYR
jgi:hypothetical protein